MRAADTGPICLGVSRQVDELVWPPIVTAKEAILITRARSALDLHGLQAVHIVRAIVEYMRRFTYRIVAVGSSPVTLQQLYLAV